MRTPDSGKLLAFCTGENLSRKNISCPLNPRYSRVLTSWLNMPSFVYNICSSTKRPQKCKKFKRVSHIYYSDAEILSCHVFYIFTVLDSLSVATACCIRKWTLLLPRPISSWHCGCWHWLSSFYRKLENSCFLSKTSQINFSGEKLSEETFRENVFSTVSTWWENLASICVYTSILIYVLSCLVLRLTSKLFGYGGWKGLFRRDIQYATYYTSVLLKSYNCRSKKACG